ncbi:MAG: hypothetical protein B6U97_02305 [Candidatus Altiarchaeales archaeon ex4484_96]|nr:MAG: hypothetical protein B6U97_02305 [Candidatus Altiarchaeales archaeon ex4484_96]
MMYVKTHHVQGEVLVAACDCDILGKKFVDGEHVFEVSIDFYMGEKHKLNTLRSLYDKASILNLAGEKTIDKAIDEGFVDEGNVIEIAGVKHAQVVVI